MIQVEDVSFRAMKHIDLPYVLSNESAAYSHPWTQGNFRTSLNGADYCCLVLVDQRAVGHGILSSGAGEAHVLNLCVHPEQQGAGLGRKLLKHLLAQAAGRKVNSVFLEVRASNSAAITLYDTTGFNEIGRRRNYYPVDVGREDAIVMAKELF